MKKPHLNGVNSIENNFSLNSQSKVKSFNETNQYLVSIFNSVTDKTPKEISITKALSIIKSDKLQIAINKIRTSENKAERDILKKYLYLFVL